MPTRFVPSLPLGQRFNPEDPNDRAAGFPVSISAKEVFQHALVLGKSGTGKTSLLLNWIFHLIINGIAFLLVEPSSFLSKDAFSASRGRADYCSLKRPRPLNPMLLPFAPATISAIIREAINEVIKLATDAANKALTAKMNVILDKVIVYCIQKGRSSLLDVLEEIERMDGDRETRDGIIARLRFLLADHRLCHIVCGPDTIDIGKLADKGQGLIVDCSGMSTEQMTFIGNIVSQSVKSHLRFADHTKLNPLCLLLDECHSYVSSDWLTVLREGRKYQLAAVLSTTDLAMFDERMRRVMLNVGSIVAFRSGANESGPLSRELHLRPEMLQFQEQYTFAFLTPSDRGFARAPSPPVLRSYQLPVELPPVVEQPISSVLRTKPKVSLSIPKPKSEPMTELTWFPITPLAPSPHETMTSGAASAEAETAKTVPSSTQDGP